MSDADRTRPPRARHSGLRASLVSVVCFLRSLPRFFRATPKTPLRVLGIIAFDTLHVLHHSRPLPRRRIDELAMLMDFEGCTNAAWDDKHLSLAEYQELRLKLAKAGLGAFVEEYLGRLRELESRRPSIGGDHRRFEEIRSYREEVVRLALAAVAAVALHTECLEEGIRTTNGDGDVETLFRIAMQCQIIDDVLDYSEDRAAGLPSLLTASASLPQAMAWTASAARSYGVGHERPSGYGVFPLRMVLHLVTAVAKLFVRVAISRDAHRTLKIRAARTRMLHR
jgi:hypothetical protein